MKISALFRHLKYYFQYFPFKINFWIYCLVLLLGYRIIQSLKTDTGSFITLTLLMAKIALIFSIIIVALSFLSVLFCTLFFLWQKKVSHQTAVEITMNTDSFENNILKVITKLPYALKPILGFVKVKLYYNRLLSTDLFILNGRIKKQFIPVKSGLLGDNLLLLPDIKSYHFSSAMVFFEDMLQFFSIPVSCQVQNSIVNLPHSLLIKTDEQLPKKTEEEKIRIEQLRKVEGEYLNYKKFDDSDDVRRIVWKIFAKNKELVVRTPETMDPFASHLYMYASFYNSLPYENHEEYCTVMLNFYKNSVWTIYDALTKKEFEVKYIPDQEISGNSEKIDPTRYKITLFDWHQDETLIDYYKPKHASILCIHSFTSIRDLASVLSAHEGGTTLFFIQLSKVFRSHYFINWMMRLFFKPPDDSLSKLKSKWVLNPFKFKVLQNEQKIMKLLKQHDINFEVI